MLLLRSKQARNRICAPRRVWNAAASATYGTCTLRQRYTSAGNLTQPIQWSSECFDPETALVYYNYRYYNPQDGRWTRRDPIGIDGGINVYSFVKNQLYRPDILGLVAPGFEGAVVVSQLNKLQEDNRRDNKQALNYCDQYAEYLGDKCCRNGQMVEDPYIAQAMQMCKQFVYKYSQNGRVIHPVECVAKCLSNNEATIKDVPDRQKRNSLRLQRHVGCYLECGFFLFDENNIGVPEGGWGVGLRDLLPDFLKDMLFL